ncbi:hypothetical protein, partial [Pseudomonas amygdali]|uniref:hypothetical protein n=1 Tax=Pseudomonas amygdali TaxID=47877 RepID=UPI001F1E74FC
GSCNRPACLKTVISQVMQRVFRVFLQLLSSGIYKQTPTRLCKRVSEPAISPNRKTNRAGYLILDLT